MISVGPPSLWHTEARATMPRWPRAARHLHCDALVIGAGLAGLGLARELMARGADVLVVDAHGPGAGASTRNAGFVLLGNATDYPRLREQLTIPGARRLLALARRSHAIIRERHGDACDYEPSGSLMLAMADDPDEHRTLRWAARELAADGVPCTLHDGAPDGLAGFGPTLEIPEDAQIHPGKLVADLARGVRGVVGTVRALDPDTRTAAVDGVPVSFHHAFVTTNAYTRKLLPDLPIVPWRAQVLATAPLPRRLVPVAYAGWGYDYFRQRADGTLIVGGRRHLHRAHEQTDGPATTPAVQRDLDAYLARHLPWAAGAPVRARWSGTMGFTSSGLPLVRYLPGPGGPITALAGFTGHGLGLALAYAEALARGDGDPLAGHRLDD